MEEIKVEKVIIGKQFEDSENYQKFLQIVNKKKIKVFVVEVGQRINIGNDLYFDILWPDTDRVVKENILNNNSLVCKFVYKNFSMLFTGDIEEIAEKKLNNKLLKADVLKVAHHGSKSSSMQSFLNGVKSKIAIIGVGGNNKFGHPNEAVLQRLECLRCKCL